MLYYHTSIYLQVIWKSLNIKIFFSNKIKNCIAINWHCSFIWSHILWSCRWHFPFYIKFNMSPSFNISCIFVLANICGSWVIYANWTKTRVISSIKCKPILKTFCFNWMYFSCSRYCTGVIRDWSIYIFYSNMPKIPAQDKNLLTWNLWRKWLKIEYKFEHNQIYISSVHTCNIYI